MNHMMKCNYCEKTFRAFRRDARFCSDSCRVSYSRLPSTLKVKAGNAWGYMADILELAKKYPDRADVAAEQLAWLQERLTILQQLVDQVRDLPENK